MEGEHRLLREISESMREARKEGARRRIRRGRARGHGADEEAPPSTPFAIPRWIAALLEREDIDALSASGPVPFGPSAARDLTERLEGLVARAARRILSEPVAHTSGFVRTPALASRVARFAAREYAALGPWPKAAPGGGERGAIGGAFRAALVSVWSQDVRAGEPAPAPDRLVERVLRRAEEQGVPLLEPAEETARFLAEESYWFFLKLARLVGGTPAEALDEAESDVATARMEVRGDTGPRFAKISGPRLAELAAAIGARAGNLPLYGPLYGARVECAADARARLEHARATVLYETNPRLGPDAGAERALYAGEAAANVLRAFVAGGFSDEGGVEGTRIDTDEFLIACRRRRDAVDVVLHYGVGPAALCAVGVEPAAAERIVEVALSWIFSSPIEAFLRAVELVESVVAYGLSYAVDENAPDGVRCDNPTPPLFYPYNAHIVRSVLAAGGSRRLATHLVGAVHPFERAMLGDRNPVHYNDYLMRFAWRRSLFTRILGDVVAERLAPRPPPLTTPAPATAAPPEREGEKKTPKKKKQRKKKGKANRRSGGAAARTGPGGPAAPAAASDSSASEGDDGDGGELAAILAERERARTATALARSRCDALLCTLAAARGDTGPAAAGRLEAAAGRLAEIAALERLARGACGVCSEPIGDRAFVPCEGLGHASRHAGCPPRRPGRCDRPGCDLGEASAPAEAPALQDEAEAIARAVEGL